jgi:sugar phosphate permease
VLAISVLVVFASLGLARFGYGILLPSMQKALELDNTGTGMLETANLVGYLLFSLIGGALASRYGPRLVISLGLLTAGSGMAATGTVKREWTAVLFRGLTGMGSGASNVPAMGLVSAWFGFKLRGLGSGIAVSGSSFAFILLGPLVPRLLEVVPESGWRLTWYFYAAAALLVTVLAAVLVRDRPEQCGLLPLGNAGDAQGERATGDGTAHKGLRWGLVYRSAPVWNLGLLYTAFGFSYIIYVTFFVRYLTGELGYTRIAAGNLFMVIGWCSLGCGLLWSGLSDRIGRKAALITVYLIQTLSYALFALSGGTGSVLLSAVLFGLTAWSIPAIVAAACGDYVGHRLAPAALGFVTLFFGTGQAFGPVVAGMIADGTGSFRGAFMLAACVACAGAAGSLFLRPPQHREGDREAAGPNGNGD